MADGFGGWLRGGRFANRPYGRGCWFGTVSRRLGVGPRFRGGGEGERRMGDGSEVGV